MVYYLFCTEYTGRPALGNGNGTPVPPVTTLRFLNCCWYVLLWRRTPDGPVQLTSERKDWLRALREIIFKLDNSDAVLLSLQM